MNLKPLGDRLIVEVLDEEDVTFSGIVLPDTAKEKPQRGRVLAVGPGARDEDGKHIPMDVAEDDEIIFSKYGGTEIKVGADEVLILRDLQQLSIKETTIILGVSEATVKTRLHRARLLLRDSLAPGIDGSWVNGKPYRKVRAW